MNDDDDESLEIFAALGGEPTENERMNLISKLYRREYPGLVRDAAKELGPYKAAAEEIVQDSFCALLSAWRLVTPDKRVLYLTQSVRNRARSVKRHRLVEAQFLALPPESPAIPPGWPGPVPGHVPKSSR